jgi:hypothetical protein
MKRPNILNPKIEQIIRKKEYHNLLVKLKAMKPLVDIHCPESFVFYKTSFHSYKTQPNAGNLNYL